MFTFIFFYGFPSAVHPQRSGSQERSGDGGQRDEDRGLWSGQRRPPDRLLQENHQREFLVATFH